MAFSGRFVSAFLSVLLVTVPVCSQEQWPEKMLKDMECLKEHGLIQGTVDQVVRGEAHFAPYMRPTTIGTLAPSIRYNGQFVEGKAPVSPDIIKLCIPNAVLQKIR
jgi:hypothetical protein